ncbi:MAG: hypothetical protein LBQ88_12130, partial [Treponema sp.]|nr:hypothetical protein [Treponema sp.]
MKRFITFSIVFALVCAAAFAEVKVSAGASMSFTPIGAVIPDDEDAGLVAGFGKNNGNAWELQLNVEGSTENGKAGFLFQWRPKVQNGVFTGINDIGDNAGIWYKPLDIIRIDAGRFQNNDIRGRMGSGAWYGDYTIPRGGENDIFQNFDAKNGAMLTVKPIDGLSVYALVNAIPPYENTNTGTPPTAWAGPNQGAAKAFGYVWENTQVAVAYAIPNIGLARLQYV